MSPLQEPRVSQTARIFPVVQGVVLPQSHAVASRWLSVSPDYDYGVTMLNQNSKSSSSAMNSPSLLWVPLDRGVAGGQLVGRRRLPEQNLVEHSARHGERHIGVVRLLALGVVQHAVLHDQEIAILYVRENGRS